ncbi:MAG: hypothetical protein KatS3mg003_1403 [Candidatus Nitrosocaldaceae archaeon]|nr:MAG: hypothetical protein KatS3mg003_1403 [Candidatus Nitrosocaldaceae archaeon]
MNQGSYVLLLIIIAISISVIVSIITLSIDLMLTKSDRVIEKINPDQTLNDIVNGTITDKIIDEINILAKQD